jgi:hypothetical protein
MLHGLPVFAPTAVRGRKAEMRVNLFKKDVARRQLGSYGPRQSPAGPEVRFGEIANDLLQATD